MTSTTQGDENGGDIQALLEKQARLQLQMQELQLQLMEQQQKSNNGLGRNPSILSHNSQKFPNVTRTTSSSSSATTNSVQRSYMNNQSISNIQQQPMHSLPPPPSVMRSIQPQQLQQLPLRLDSPAPLTPPQRADSIEQPQPNSQLPSAPSPASMTLSTTVDALDMLLNDINEMMNEANVLPTNSIHPVRRAQTSAVGRSVQYSRTSTLNALSLAGQPPVQSHVSVHNFHPHYAQFAPSHQQPPPPPPQPPQPPSQMHFMQQQALMQMQQAQFPQTAPPPIGQTTPPQQPQIMFGQQLPPTTTMLLSKNPGTVAYQHSPAASLPYNGQLFPPIHHQPHPQQPQPYPQRSPPQPSHIFNQLQSQGAPSAQLQADNDSIISTEPLSSSSSTPPLTASNTHSPAYFDGASNIQSAGLGIQPKITVKLLTSIVGTYFGNVERMAPQSRDTQSQNPWTPIFFVVAGVSIYAFNATHSPHDEPIDSIQLSSSNFAPFTVASSGAGMLVISGSKTAKKVPSLHSLQSGASAGTAATKTTSFKPWILRASSEDEGDAWMAIIQSSIDMAAEHAAATQKPLASGIMTKGASNQVEYVTGTTSSSSIPPQHQPPLPGSQHQLSSRGGSEDMAEVLRAQLFPTLAHPNSSDGTTAVHQFSVPASPGGTYDDALRNGSDSTLNYWAFNGNQTNQIPFGAHGNIPRRLGGRRLSDGQISFASMSMAGDETVNRPGGPKRNDNFDVLSQSEVSTTDENRKSKESSLKIKKVFGIRMGGFKSSSSSQRGDGDTNSDAGSDKGAKPDQFVYLVRGGARQPGRNTQESPGNVFAQSKTNKIVVTPKLTLPAGPPGAPAANANPERGLNSPAPLTNKNRNMSQESLTFSDVQSSNSDSQKSTGPTGTSSNLIGVASVPAAGGQIAGKQSAPQVKVVVLSKAPEPKAAPKKKTDVFLVRGGAKYNSQPSVNRLVKVSNADNEALLKKYEAAAEAKNKSKVFQVRGGARNPGV